MATDRVTKKALAAEKEFSQFLDDLNQYEFMRVYDDEDQVSQVIIFCLSLNDNAHQV